jgi:hypothetical protein
MIFYHKMTSVDNILLMDIVIKSLSNLQISNQILLLKEDILEETKNNLINIMNVWCDNYCNNYNGGKMRGNRGSDIETFVKNTINNIGRKFNINLVAKNGNRDKYKLVVDSSEKICKNHQVDIHIYLDNKFISVIECKAYLDNCYYSRACHDFKLFKIFKYSVKNYIFALENSISDNTLQFENYINKYICDDIFYILDGKRSSQKPIYNPKYKKEINIDNLIRFIDFIYILSGIN